MFALFRRSSRPRRAPELDAEIAAMCTAQQFEALSLPRALRRDVGLSCGCDPLPHRRSILD